jgi:hypothetical protein
MYAAGRWVGKSKQCNKRFYREIPLFQRYDSWILARRDTGGGGAPGA